MQRFTSRLLVFVVDEESARRLGKEQEQEEAAENGGHCRQRQQVLPQVGLAEKLAKAESLRHSDAHRDEELMNDAGGAAQAVGRYLGQVGRYETARHAALDAVDETADHDTDGRVDAWRYDHQDGAGQREHIVKDDALLATKKLGHILRGEGADHAADDEGGRSYRPQQGHGVANALDLGLEIVSLFGQRVAHLLVIFIAFRALQRTYLLACRRVVLF